MNLENADIWVVLFRFGQFSKAFDRHATAGCSNLKLHDDNWLPANWLPLILRGSADQIDSPSLIQDKLSSC